MNIKYFFERKRLILISFTSILLGITYTYCTYFNKEDSISNAFEFLVGFNDYTEWSIQNLTGLFVIFILSFPLIDYYSKDYSKTTTYIFSRIKSRVRWAVGKNIFLCLYCFISALIYITTKIICSGVYFSAQNLFISFIMFFLFFVVFCSFVCSVSLFIGAVKSYLIAVITFSVLCYMVTLYYFNPKNLLGIVCVLFNPVARYMLNWNSNLIAMLTKTQAIFFETTNSILFLILVFIINIILSIIAVKNKNISIKYINEE